MERFRNQVKNYPQWDAARYQRAVGGTFDAVVNNNDDYMAVVNAAASQNKPVVMLIGSGSDPASRHVIENSMKEAKSRNGRDAVYAFVDLDRVDKNSSIGRYALENMPRQGQEPPFTMVFGMSRGDARNPVRADAPTYYTMGPPETAAVNEAVSRLKLQMTGQFSNLPRPDQLPNPTTRPDAPVQPDTRAVDQRTQESIAMALIQAQRTGDKESSYKLYKQAVDLADGSKNPLLQAATRTELGIACLNWGHKETGYKWIMEGASKNPDFFNDQKNQQFKERLTQAGVPAASINMMIENGKRDPIWHTKDRDAGKKVEAAAATPVAPAPFVNPFAPGPRPDQVQPQPRPDQIQPQVRPQGPHLMPSPFRR